MATRWVLSWEDDFASVAVLARWVAGHYTLSDECRLAVQDGVRITLAEGREYASAGVVAREPIAGDFAAEVDFAVSAPATGTTFELAAITAAPPAQTHLAPVREDQCAKVFDVHGQPPYVSSEFDEADGWRMGWNRHPPLYKPKPGGGVMADGRNNVYCRDDGPKPTGAASGGLRLVREGGQRWSAFRRGDESMPWHPLPADRNPPPSLAVPVFLRLVGKHWVKHKAGQSAAPGNEIVFRRFRLYRPA